MTQMTKGSLGRKPLRHMVPAVQRTSHSLSRLDEPAADPGLWQLDPALTFLNHGSFGACPRAVLEFQSEIRRQMEREPVRFFQRELELLFDEARAALAGFLGADAADIVPVANATQGVNTVLRSVRFAPGDEILVTDHEYNATRNAAEYAAEMWGANVVVAHIPYPIGSAEEIVQAILGKVTVKTRFAVVDHVTSQTGLIFPIDRLAREFAARGIELLVDGAHAPGMLPLQLGELGVPYYTGNCHKWLCAPKGAAFLYVRKDRQERIRPLSISHGANSPRTDRSRFLIEFGWTGTGDPSGFLSVPTAIRFMEALLPGGWPEVMARNHALAASGRTVLCEALEIDLPAPDDLFGALASVPLSDADAGVRREPPMFLDPLQDLLFHRERFEVPVVPWPAWPKRLIRISAQLYNSLPQYQRLAEIVRQATIRIQK